VHQIISGLPGYKFGIVYLGGEASAAEEMQYVLPDNVVHFEKHFIEHSWKKRKSVASKGNSKAFKHCWHVHAAFKDREQSLPDADVAAMMNQIGDDKNGISLDDFLFSENAWRFITKAYEEYSEEPSFINYFWTIRSMHAPLFMLKNVARNIPDVPVVHSVSTGYAGLLASLICHRKPDTRFILSEHGIYTKERKIDLAQAEWIYDSNEALTGSANPQSGYIRQLWIGFFEQLSRICYQAADPIVALYEGNRQRQIKDGADEARTRVIPNGIVMDDFTEQAKPSLDRPVIALVGRVVPIKDIKTFIRAMRSVCNSLPDAEAWIVGPEDEDVDYVLECRSLVSSLGLEDKVLFKGFQKVSDVMPKIQLLMLTSISEAQPLVLLEAMAAGVPQVTTDVGSCRELIEGGIDEDRDLGSTGKLVNIADPMASAEACLSLLQDSDAWHKASVAGQQRVRRYYTQSTMFERYQALYEQALSGAAKGEVS
jgi:glycosyltransferase involved in cell wall biosynthesis